MKTLTTPVKFTTLHGPLYIAVARAELREWYDTERGDVSELRPMLRIASDPAFEADPAAADHWTIRNRAYAVHYEIFFEDRTAIEYRNGFQGERWHRGGYTKGGFRKDNRGPVEYGTKTFELMWEEVTRALDTFDAQNTGWMDLSRYLYCRGEQASHESKAAELRREAAGHDAQALKQATAATALADGIPAALLDTILPATEA